MPSGIAGEAAESSYYGARGLVRHGGSDAHVELDEVYLAPFVDAKLGESGSARRAAERQ